MAKTIFQSDVQEPSDVSVVTGSASMPNYQSSESLLLKGLSGLADMGIKRSAGDELNKTSESLKQEISDYYESRDTLARTTQQLQSTHLPEEDRNRLKELEGQLKVLANAKQKRLMRGGDIDTRVRAKGKELISRYPHLSSEIRAMVSGHTGTVELPPSVEAAKAFQEKATKDGFLAGFDMNDPQQAAQYMAWEHKKYLSDAKASVAANEAASAKHLTGGMVAGVADLANSQAEKFIMTVPSTVEGGWSNKESILGGFAQVRAQYKVAVQKQMSSIDRNRANKGLPPIFGTPEARDKVLKSADDIFDLHQARVEQYVEQPLKARERAIKSIQSKAQLSSPTLIGLRASFGDRNLDWVLKKWDEVIGMNESQWLTYSGTMNHSQAAAASVLRTMDPNEIIGSVIQDISAGQLPAMLKTTYSPVIVKHAAGGVIKAASANHNAGGELDEQGRRVVTNSLKALLQGEVSEEPKTWTKLLNSNPVQQSILLNDPKVFKELKHEFGSMLSRQIYDVSAKISDVNNLRINTKTNKIEHKYTPEQVRQEGFAKFGYDTILDYQEEVKAINQLEDLYSMSHSPNFEAVSDIQPIAISGYIIKRLSESRSRPAGGEE